MGRKLGGGSLVIKAVFVLAENDFRKSFYMKLCVWLRMENRVFRKIIYFDRKIAPLTRKIFSASVLPSNHFRRHAKRERERSGRRAWDRTGQITILVPSMRWWDHATNPWTDRPTSSTGEITPRTHKPIAVLVPSTRWWAPQTHEPTNRSTHLVHWRDRATNPWTNRPIPHPHRWTHEPIVAQFVLWFWFFLFWFLFLVLFICFNYL